MKKSLTDHCKDWLDTLVVALSVAMAFRAYFYEPFKIPTGSMQETLWGYHTQADAQPGTWDKSPLSWFKWLWTGERYVEIKAPVSGVVDCQPRNDGFASVRVGYSPETWSLPTDACLGIKGKSVKAGDVIWKGSVITGDFIFVNRWKWNFFKPQNNEVMIFSTTGIAGLMQGTHYIKRMKARPGETYVLEHPVKDRPDVVTMKEGEYFACGDNFNNSYDSRYWGPVPAENLRGSAAFVFWPFNGWRIIK